MKNIQVLFLLLLILVLASCVNDNGEDEKPSEISAEVIEQAKKEIFESDTSQDIAKTETKVITLNAKEWEYDKKEIRVKKWEKLILKVNNIDTLHGIAIPGMQLVWDEQIEVDTSTVWEYEYRCSNYCWAGHQEMAGMLIIGE